jgi:protein TonB
MPTSYWDREASYRKRIGIIIPVAIVLLVAPFFLSGRLEYQEVSHFVGWHGPIELLPEITVEPEPASPPASPPVPPPVSSPATAGAAALDVAEQTTVDAGPTDLEPNPPRIAQAAPRTERIGPLESPAQPASYSENYVILHMVKPTYPPRELAAGIEGNVTVELVVDERGRVTDAIVVSSIGPVSFQESTLEAVREFRFQPLIEDGKPTTMRIKFLVKFRILA